MAPPRNRTGHTPFPTDKYSMDINELESFKLSDAVAFHKELNPRLWEDEKLDPEVRNQLLLIAEDFVEYLGISNLKVRDVTISGSNAAYSYTPHSDLDLHVLVDFNELPNNEVYQELFTAKKTLYNDAHNITVRDVPVELYVQDTNNPVQSLGEYSIVHDKWIRIPKKRRANFDQAATKLKYEKLGDLIELALQSKDPKRISDAIGLLKRYRKSGLDKTGEFGPENLAYKAVRKQGLVKDLYDLKSQLHAEKLSIEEAASRDDAVLKIKKLQNLKGRTPNEIATTQNIIEKLMKQWNIVPAELGIRTPVDPLQAKIRKAAYEKHTAANMFKQEWERFKKGIFAEEETVNELFNKPYATTPKDDDNYLDNDWHYEFTTSDGSKYVVSIFDPDGYPMIAFAKQENGKYVDTTTNTGDQYKIFATVGDVLKNFLTNEEPNQFAFAGIIDDPSRLKLYDKISQYIDKMLPDYKLIGKPSESMFTGGKKGRVYEFVRITYSKRNADYDYDEEDNLTEDFTSKQQVINYFVSRGKSAAQGAAAWERGWRGAKPKQAKPYDPERYKNVRLPYIDEAESDAKKAPTIQFKTWERRGIPRHSFRVTFNGKDIAFGEVEKDNEWDDDRGASVQEIVVVSAYRRKGVATKIYNEIERRFNYKLHPSDDVKPDGQEFWKARGNLDEATDPTFNVNETDDRKAAVLKIQKHLNKKYGANLDLDGKLGPLTLKSINKFMPRAKTGLADEPNKTTAVQGKKLKEAKIDAHRQGDTIWINYFEVPEKGKGLGTQEYMKFEKSLPKDIKKIRLVASDAGYGPTHEFWDRMGFDYAYPDDDNEMVKLLEAAGTNLVYRVDKTKIPDFDKNLKTYYHNDDWSMSGSEWEGATGSAKGLYAHPDKLFVALYAAGTPETNRYVATYNTSPPMVYFDKKDVSKFKNTKSYLTAFDASTFKKVPSGEVFSDMPGKPVHQIEITDPFEFIKQQGWGIKLVDDLPAKLKEIKKIAKEKNIKYGAEGMDMDLHEASGYIPSEKEKNDPRFKTALTRDVTPNSNKDNARAFGWKVSRAGIPPQARADGKIAEDLMREFKTFLSESALPKIGYHVTATKNLPIIQKNGINTDKRGSSYIWDSREMAEWFMDFQNDEGQDRTILKIDMSGLDANPDPEAEDMSEWSSKFKPGTNGGAWIISGPIPSDKIIG